MNPPSATSAPVSTPQKVPVQAFRPAQKNIPPTRSMRETLQRHIRRKIDKLNLTPPLSTDKLREIADTSLYELGYDSAFREYTGILINNELWRESLAQVPFHKRLLLLPKCLRIEAECPAPFDEFGLLCKQCGLCSIQDLQLEAEKLGYAVLVAEGSAIVMNIIQTGKIEAIVGVSCISVLERAFPFMEAAAIPGVAIPLLQSDCKDTTVDMEWIWDYIHLSSEDQTRRLDLDALREDINTWFNMDNLNRLLGESDNPCDQHARQWLGQFGKRWRPLLTVASAKALDPEACEQHSDDLMRCAIAVECFHKASLIHDDIEDEDELRYGEPTLHQRIGIAAAINVGDLLIGEGYRLITETQCSPEIKARMLKVAAYGHRMLSLGQGRELDWRQSPRAIEQNELLTLFREKTSPAFSVALRLGALFAKADENLENILQSFSESLGISYQIRDDGDDLEADAEGSDLRPDRPSLALTLSYARGKEEDRQIIESFWKGEAAADQVQTIFNQLNIPHRMRELQESFREQALRHLDPLNDMSLKSLLRRIVAKIFNEFEITGWCNEHQTTNAASSSPSPSGAR